MNKFKEGDRVRAIFNYGLITVGMTGTMILPDAGGVDWDDLSAGHSLQGHPKCRPKHGFYTLLTSLELIDYPDPIEYHIPDPFLTRKIQ